MEVFRNLKI